MLTDSSRLHGVVRDKATFSEQLNPDGTVNRPAYARYLVKILGRPDEEALLDQEHITRDRKVYTKHMIRAFIKTTVTREAWSGAPWLVKPSVAAAYKLPTEVPSNLLQSSKKKPGKKTDDGFGLFAPQGLPDLKPAGRPSLQELARSKQEQFLAYQRSLNVDRSFAKPPNFYSTPSSDVPQEGMMYMSQDDMPPEARKKRKKIKDPPFVVKDEPSRPPSPVQIKYPIEDLELPPDREKPRRPSVKFLEEDLDADADDEYFVESDIESELVGILLEVWNTLNVFCEVFQLDSFTFDDFLQAMRFSSEEMDCELFVEIHCAVLKKLVNSENSQNGTMEVYLPDFPVQSEESEESGEDLANKEGKEPSPEPSRRMTRSSLTKVDADSLNGNGTVGDSTNTRVHRAADMFQGYSWIDRLRKRDFRNGGWELVMIGLLDLLSFRPHLEKVCNEILTQLAPLDAEPTQETARVQYSILDLDLRAKALQIICMLSLETKAIKNYMDECSNQMTEFRKEKVEYQRERKAM